MVRGAKMWIPARSVNFRSTPGAPSSHLLFFQKRPPKTKRRRLGLGCMFHFLHSGQMAAVCSSSSQSVRDRTSISMAKGVCSEVIVVKPPRFWCVRHGSFPRETAHTKRDHFKETRCAPISVPNGTPSTFPTMSSLSVSLRRAAANMGPKEE